MCKRELWISWITAILGYAAAAAGTAWCTTLFAEGEEPVSWLGSLQMLVTVTGLPFLLSCYATFATAGAKTAKAKNLSGFVAVSCGMAALICAATPTLALLGFSLYEFAIGKHLGTEILGGLLAAPILGLIMGSPMIVVFGSVLGTLLWEDRQATQSAKTCTQIPSL